MVELGVFLCGHDQSLGRDPGLDRPSTSCAYSSLEAPVHCSVAAHHAKVWAHLCLESPSLVHRGVSKAQLTSFRERGHVARQIEIWALEERPEVGSCWIPDLISRYHLLLGGTRLRRPKICVLGKAEICLARSCCCPGSDTRT